MVNSAGRRPLVLLDELAQIEQAADPSTTFLAPFAEMIGHLNCRGDVCGWVLATTPQFLPKLLVEKAIAGIPVEIIKLRGCAEPGSARDFCRNLARSLPSESSRIVFEDSAYDEICNRVNRNWRGVTKGFSAIVTMALREGWTRVDVAKVRDALDPPAPEPRLEVSSWIPPGLDEGLERRDLRIEEQRADFGENEELWSLVAPALEILQFGVRHASPAAYSLGLAQLLALRGLVEDNGDRDLSRRSPAKLIAQVKRQGWIEMGDPGWWPLRHFLECTPADDRGLRRILPEGREHAMLTIALDKVSAVKRMLTLLPRERSGPI